jgi:hypothetical protein
VRCFGQEATIDQCERVVSGRRSLDAIEDPIQTSLTVSIRSGIHAFAVSQCGRRASSWRRYEVSAP